MGNVVYGYVRISTKDQNPDRQIYALKEYGINEDNIFVDRLSGKNFVRPDYKRMMKKLRRGDHICIVRSNGAAAPRKRCSCSVLNGAEHRFVGA